MPKKLRSSNISQVTILSACICHEALFHWVEGLTCRDQDVIHILQVSMYCSIRYEERWPATSNSYKWEERYYCPQYVSMQVRISVLFRLIKTSKSCHANSMLLYVHWMVSFPSMYGRATSARTQNKQVLEKILESQEWLMSPLEESFVSLEKSSLACIYSKH